MLKGIVVSLLLAASAIPPFPFKTYSDVPVESLQPMCEGQAMLVTTVGEDWVGLSSKTRDIFIHLTAGKPDFAYLLEGDGVNPIVVKESLPYKDLEKRVGDACAYVTGSGL